MLYCSIVNLRSDEYESGDTSDEEERRNTAGSVPMWWYNEYPHAGYDLDGRKLMKPPQRDQIDEFLKSVKNFLASFVTSENKKIRNHLI